MVLILRLHTECQRVNILPIFLQFHSSLVHAPVELRDAPGNSLPTDARPNARMPSGARSSTLPIMFAVLSITRISPPELVIFDVICGRTNFELASVRLLLIQPFIFVFGVFAKTRNHARSRAVNHIYYWSATHNLHQRRTSTSTSYVAREMKGLIDSTPSRTSSPGCS